jgi:3-oxoadipate CoA-transferase beta subunit
MDLAIGAKEVYVIMSLFGKDGTPKLVPSCTYPLTGRRCVSRVYTDYAKLVLTDGTLRVRETYGISLSRLAERVPSVGPVE